jgi:tRNA A-37 threonylcarbamoyl transferase component Bud32
MFATLYVKGHLVTVAFAVSMAVAFAVTALRVPGQRDDWWLVGGFLVTASLGVVEMALCLQPGQALARAHLVLGGGLLFFVAMGIFLRYRGDLSSALLRRRTLAALVGYGALTVVVCLLVGFGALERATHTRTIELFGVRVMMAHFRVDGFVLQLVYTCLQPALLLPMLLADGERRSERRMLALPIALVPLVGLYEDLICLGVSPLLPLSGYYATAAGLTGAFILAERIRTLTRPPEMVGRYQLGRLLGGGGMADVYEAHPTGEAALINLARRVAVKRMRPELAGDGHFARMFLDEARLVARLSHPHIVAVHDIGQEGGELYIAMELVEGTTLSRVLARLRALGEPCEPAATVAIGAQLCDALAYAHALCDEAGRSLKIIHRDVSPQNILITRSGHLKLVDFGIARSADRQAYTEAGRLKGKAAYLAPECIRGEPYDHRVDLYAVGVVLFELVTGVKPFDGKNDAEVVHRILSGSVSGETRLRVVPAPLRELILALLAADPDERPASAAEVYAQLARMQSGDAHQEIVRLVADTEAALARPRHEQHTAAARPRAGAL